MATLVALDHLIRRARCLVCHWDGERVVLENYLSRRRAVVDPAVMLLLSPFENASTRSAVEDHFFRIVGVSGVVEMLLDADILIPSEGVLSKKEQLLDKWDWGHDARYFHFSTRDVQYNFDHENVRGFFEEKAKRIPPPPPFKTCEGQFTPLPSPVPLGAKLGESLQSRRTGRDFARSEISLQDLATLLHGTWGMQQYFNESQLDRRVLKTSPSGGSRHPIEVYPVVQRVSGAAPGIYHYSVERHGLTMLREGVCEDEMADLFSGQNWVRDASALFFMTAVLSRSMWKYDHSRAYRVVMLDAGHLGQTFHLVATGMGLSPFTTAALQDGKIECALGIDSVTEVAVYAGAVGRIAS